MTGGPQQEESAGEPVGGDVESAKPSAQKGGWAGRETGGGQREAVPDDHEGGDVDEVRAWAREWAKRLPDWSDEQWRRINAGLGYRVRTRKAGKSKKPDTHPPR